MRNNFKANQPFLLSFANLFKYTGRAVVAYWGIHVDDDDDDISIGIQCGVAVHCNDKMLSLSYIGAIYRYWSKQKRNEFRSPFHSETGLCVVYENGNKRCIKGQTILRDDTSGDAK